MARKKTEAPIIPKPKRRSPTKYTPAIAKFIIEKLSSGINLSQICRQFPEKLLHIRTVQRWQDEHQDFRKSMDDAYDCYLKGALDRLEDVSLSKLVDLYPELDGKDAYEQRRSAQLYYNSALKIAGQLSKRWQTASKVQHTGLESVHTVYQVINYHAPIDSPDIRKDIRHVVDIARDSTVDTAE